MKQNTIEDNKFKEPFSGIESIGNNTLTEEISIKEGWKRIFQNENFQIMYKTQDFSVPGLTLNIPTPNVAITAERSITAPAMQTKASLYVTWNLALANKKENKLDDCAVSFTLSSLDNGMDKLEKSKLPEDAKELIKKHFEGLLQGKNR